MVWQEVPLDKIYYDDVTGVPGTLWPIGTPQVPSDVIADVIAMCAARNLNIIHVTGTLAVGAGIAQTLTGHHAILTVQTAGAAYVRNFSGYLEIDEMTGGTITIVMNGGTVTINADCTGGTINIWGSAVVTNNAVGAVVNNYTLDQRAANIDTQLDGMLVQVPFYNDFLIDAGQTLTMFEFDALGATIREIFISFWLESDGGATFTPTWEKTSILAPVTWTVEVIPALANIVAPPADAYYSYKLGEIAQGLQGRFRIAQVGGANDNVVDAFAVVKMVV